MVAEMTIRRILGLAALLFACAGGARAGDGDHLSVALTSDSATVPAGGQVWLGIEERPAAGWHTYWINPGDSGEAPQVAWSLPRGAAVSSLRFPAPRRLAYPGVVTYGYDAPVVLLARLTVPAALPAGADLPVRAHVSTLVCAEVCEPVEADVAIDLRVGAAATGRLAQALAALPRPLDGHPRIAHETDPTLTFTPPAGVTLAVGGESYLFPEDGRLWPAGVDERFSTDGHVLNVTLHGGHAWRAPGARGVLRLGDGRAYEVALAPQTPAPAWDLVVAVGLALAGGLVLNLMPCVFPVLSMKLLAITRTGHDRGLARLEAASYFAGVVSSFVLLALALEAARAMGLAVGWGFQLQSPVVTGLLSAVLLLVGLNLSGLFEIGAGLQSLTGGLAIGGTGRFSALLGAGLTGVLAVVVAAPCTAPFMATAIGFALTRGGWPSVAVFTALGTGFALPFVLLTLAFTAMPGLARFMPRPGAWMNRLRQALAIPMYAAALWMTWVFAQQAGITATIGLAAALAALVLFLATRAWPPAWRSLILVMAIGLGIGGAAAAVTRLEAPIRLAAAGDRREAFSAERLAQLRGEGRPVLVDLTAGWCVTCKVNESLVLENSRVAAAMARTGTVWMVGDWTRRDAAITGYLSQFGRSGVPLYVLYLPNADPRVLPQVLTVDEVVSAVGSS